MIDWHGTLQVHEGQHYHRDSLPSNHMPHPGRKCPYDCHSTPSAATFCFDPVEQPAESISVKW